MKSVADGLQKIFSGSEVKNLRLLSQSVDRRKNAIVRPHEKILFSGEQYWKSAAPNSWIYHDHMNGSRGEERVAGSQDQRCFHDIVRLDEVRDIHDRGLSGNIKNHTLHGSHVGIAQPKICREGDDGLRSGKHTVKLYHRFSRA